MLAGEGLFVDGSQTSQLHSALGPLLIGGLVGAMWATRIYVTMILLDAENV